MLHNTQSYNEATRMLEHRRVGLFMTSFTLSLLFIAATNFCNGRRQLSCLISEISQLMGDGLFLALRPPTVSEE